VRLRWLATVTVTQDEALGANQRIVTA